MCVGVIDGEGRVGGFKLMPKKRLTPQEKKVRSYQNDCRSTYGNNDKAARKAIPFNKKLVNSRERLLLKNNLREAIDDEDALITERSPNSGWRKANDEPLGSYLNWRPDIEVIGRNRSMKSELQKEARKRLKAKGNINKFRG